MAADVEADPIEPIEETITGILEVNKINGITGVNGVEEEESEDNLIVGGGGMKERRGVEQPTNVIAAKKDLVQTGQSSSSSSCDCYGFDDGDLPGLLFFGKLLKKLFLIKFLMVICFI